MEKQVVFFGICYYSGLIRLAHWCRQRGGQQLIILNYHRASGGDLRRHLLYLRRYYRVLPLEEALKELYAPEQKRKQIRDRRTPLALTFDDGYRDNYTHGFPLVCTLQVPMTIFLIPTYIDSSRCFWWLEGERLVLHAQVKQMTLEGQTYHLERQEDRKMLIEAIYTRVRDARSVAAREAFFEQIREALAVPATATIGGEAVLKWAEIREMEQSGWVSFGAHTMHHPVLGYLAAPTEVHYEVSECRCVLEQQLGHPVCTFAYPLGRPEHIGEVAPQAVREAGYSYAVTTNNGVNTRQSDPLGLLRIAADVKWHWLLLAADTSGLRQLCSPLLFPFGRRLWSTGSAIVSVSSQLLKAGYRKLRGGDNK